MRKFIPVSFSLLLAAGLAAGCTTVQVPQAQGAPQRTEGETQSEYERRQMLDDMRQREISEERREEQRFQDEQEAKKEERRHRQRMEEKREDNRHREDMER